MFFFSFFFFNKDNKQKKGQSYSNEPMVHFGGSIAGLVNSIHIFCVSFLTYRTSGKMQLFEKDIMCLLSQRFCLQYVIKYDTVFHGDGIWEFV